MTHDILVFGTVVRAAPQEGRETQLLGDSASNSSACKVNRQHHFSPNVVGL